MFPTGPRISPHCLVAVTLCSLVTVRIFASGVSSSVHTEHTEGEVWASEMGQREKVLDAKPVACLDPATHGGGRVALSRVVLCPTLVLQLTHASLSQIKCKT